MNGIFIAVSNMWVIAFTFFFFFLAQGDMVRQFFALVLPYGPTGHTTPQHSTLNLSKPF
ncbi:MAG: hypothetical protein PVG41_13155 [Desulfobacteraceae bacterium]